MESNPYLQALFGCHAMQASCQLVLQPMGQFNGKHVTAVVAILNTEESLLSAEAQEMNAPHELIVGDLVIRPFGKWAGSEYKGTGLAGIVTGPAMFPDGWSTQTLDNGYKAPPQGSRRVIV